MWKREIRLIIPVLFAVWNQAAAKEFLSNSILNLDNSPDYLMGNYVSFLEDIDGMDYNDVLKLYQEGHFQPLGHERLFNQGYTESLWWFAFRIKNTLEKENMVIFSPVGASIREGILYIFDDQEQLTDKQYSGFLYG